MTRLFFNRWFVYGVIICLALGLRLHHLDRESLFMDEILQVSFYQGSFLEIKNRAVLQLQPPLDYWIGALFYRLSDSDFMVRLPALLWGTGSVIAVMLLSSTFTSWPVAAFTGLLMALSPYHIYFSQDARPYSISIFFLLIMLFSLKYLLTSVNIRKIDYIVFFIICFGFLLTRTLTPLVVCVSIMFILSIYLLADISKYGLLESRSFRQSQTRLITVLVLFSFSLLLYLPLFLQILNTGQRYLNTTEFIKLSYLISRLSELSFNDIIQAWAVQLEPFTLLFTTLICLTPFLLKTEKNGKKSAFVYFLIILLLLSCSIHYTVFRLRTDAPFRPPYAVYILPLVLLISSFALDKIRMLVVERYSNRFSTALVSIVLLTITGVAVASLSDFKSIRKKTDWRSVGSYLGDTYGAESLITFLSLEPTPHWSPVFFGFDRYYDGKSQRISISQITDVKNQLYQIDLRPVLLLFHYRDYFLTSHSQYSFIPGIRDVPFQWQLSRLPADLIIKSFTGFSLISLDENEPSILKKNTAEQLHYMIDSILSAAPQDSALVELHMNAFSLTPSENSQHRIYHLEKAKNLARPDQHELITRLEHN